MPVVRRLTNRLVLGPAVAIAAVSLVACASPATTPEPPAARVIVLCDAVSLPWVQPAVAAIGDPRATAGLANAATSTAEAWVVRVATTAVCDDCFSIARAGRTLNVAGGKPRGIQYGVFAAFESLGYRFAHPRHSYLPKSLPSEPAALPKGEQTPFVAERRGLHLHTIHPTEAYFDFWMPGLDHLENAKAVGEFVLRHRGNYLQWVGLDDIIDDSKAQIAWREHTRAINQHLHSRGLKTGIAIQLFGASNLQKGFDLIDVDPEPAKEMARRLQLVLAGNGFDTVNLSFGEFSGAKPETFIASVNEAYEAMQTVHKGVDVAATIHVGDTAETRVIYQGQQMIYYFLVQFCNPAIRPWVHTVMYYNLFEDAGGAYHHKEFDAHRNYLLDRLKVNKQVGYFPETAYWVAFDVNVPTYVPLYLRSRWLDLDEIAKRGPPLRDHVLFSSGWEWGYWQHDALTLDASYTRTPTWDSGLRSFWSAWGEQGTRMADRIAKLGDLQHKGLIQQRLAAYLAGREATMDVGYTLGIVSQPDRLTFDKLRPQTPEQRADFRTKVVAPLAELSKGTRVLAEKAATDHGGDAWLTEAADGIEVTALRGEYVVALYESVLADADGKGADRDAAIGRAEAALKIAKATVARRHARLWDGPSQRTLLRAANATVYPYGYLHEADTLCFWERELVQVRNLLLGQKATVPGCIF